YFFVLYFCTYRCFFFSSRRRHTRSKRDWSSDVCSSDLVKFIGHAVLSDHGSGQLCGLLNIIGSSTGTRRSKRPGRRREGSRSVRSEERRVGKECRFLLVKDC